MVSGGNHRPTDDENTVIGSFPTIPAGVRNSVTPALSTGHSVSTCGSASSPSGPSEQAAVATPVSESTVRRLNHLDIHGDDAGSSQGSLSFKKKKKITRAVAGDKSGRGLRQFSMKVCEKVESKGRTTYNEVADELVAEFAEPNNSPATPDQQQYEEKNIRRRVYDALNVLMAMDIISKDKKDIQWKGLPRTSLNDIEELKAERAALKGRVDKKTAYLQELEDQIIGLQNLILRNEQLHDTENGASGGVALPFILVQTRPHATVEIEIAEDMQLVHFDFNSTPFELHDDTYVLKAMRFCNQEETGGAHEPVLNGGECSSVLVACPPQLQKVTMRTTGSSVRVPSPNTPLPGILKTRIKHDHQNQ